MRNPVPLSPRFRELLADIWRDRLTFGGQLFTYLTQRHFGIIRFPTHPDRLSCVGRDGRTAGAPDYLIDQERIGALLERLSPNDLASLQGEYGEIVERMQERLQSEYGPLVRLYRAIGQPVNDVPNNYKPALQAWPEMVAQCAVAASQAGVVNIRMEMDIVSGWCRHATSSVYGGVVLAKDIPTKNILLLSDYFDGGERIGPLESNEFLVVNRNPTGLVEFLTSDVDCSALDRVWAERLPRQRGTMEFTKAMKALEAEPTRRLVALNDQAFARPMPPHPVRWPSRLANWIELRFYAGRTPAKKMRPRID